VLGEYDLRDAGLLEGHEASAAARLLAVRYLFVGSILQAGDRLHFTIKVLDGSTGQQVAFAEWTMGLSDDMAAMLVSLEPSQSPSGGEVPGSPPTSAGSPRVSAVRRGRCVIVTARAEGNDDLRRLQEARRLTRNAYAEYVMSHVVGHFRKEDLVAYARDHEKIEDATESDGVLILVSCIPIPEGR